MIVFVVQHIHLMKGGEEDTKLIGVFSSFASAQEAIAQLRKQPGFNKVPNGFHVDEYVVDKTNWLEGYSTSNTESQ